MFRNEGASLVMSPRYTLYSLHKSKNCHFFLVTKHTVVGLWGPTHSGSYTVDKQWLKPPYPAPR